MSAESRQPVFFVSHGGGPWPWIQEMRSQYAQSIDHFGRLPYGLPQPPKAILCVSAHWETQEFTVSTASQPGMIYDYTGFPPHTYQVNYPASGSPELAGKVGYHLSSAGFKVEIDANRGFDHGVFVPLSLMFPDASIPIATLSIRAGYNPIEHMKIGEALEPLRSEGYLIIASGLTFHNLREFNHLGHKSSEIFEDFLQKTIALEKSERKKTLAEWSKALCARSAHPREDHLVPLFVAVGAAGADAGKVFFTEQASDIYMGNYLFGEFSPVNMDALKAMGIV